MKDLFTRRYQAVNKFVDVSMSLVALTVIVECAIPTIT